MGTSRVVVYDKWAKKEVKVIFYFLITSEWHACSHFFMIPHELSLNSQSSDGQLRTKFVYSVKKNLPSDPEINNLSKLF